MAETTQTLQQLRRAVCKELRMPFFRRFSSSSTATSGAAAGLLVDSALTQDDDFWAGHWAYHVDSQEVRLIKAFLAESDTAIPERDFTSLSSTDEYEIQSLWNATEIADALNRAIQSANRVYIDTVSDETLILEEDKLAYVISGLTKLPYFISKIWIEGSTSTLRGDVESSTATTLTDAGSFASVTSDWKVSIYNGTGKGQIRAISSSTDDTLTVAAWDTNPDSTSMYAVWDPTEQINDWTLISGYHLDSPEFPSSVYFTENYPSRYGMRIRIEYLAVPGELSAETDTTIVPKEYLINKSAAFLHSQMSGDLRYDRDFHFSESIRFDEMATNYLNMSAPHIPSQTITTASDAGTYAADDDPFNWYV
jgi:hypothetical protein